MNWLVIVTKKTRKKVDKFPAKDQIKIRAELHLMENNPFTGDVVWMKDEDLHRRRVGSYRIIFEKLDGNVVRVYKIERRTSKTYR